MHEFADEPSIADDMLRSGYERWHRLEEEKAAIGEDLKELFAELKANGFAPKALRESFRRVRNIDDASQQEHDAIVDLYVASLTGARPAHTREGDDDQPDHDAETGEIIEPGNGAGTATADQAPQVTPAVASHSALSSHGADAPVSSGAPAEEIVPPIFSALIQPDYSSDVTPEAVEQMRQMAAPALAAMGDLEVVDTVSFGSAADPGEGIALSPALSDHIVDVTEKIAPTKLKMNAEFFEESHPLCKNPHGLNGCGGNSKLRLCVKCRAEAGIVDGHDGPTFQPEAAVH